MKLAEETRFQLIDMGISFTFETVLSTREKIDFLKWAKNEGYLIKTIYITTADPKINVKRVEERKKQGGHGVPIDKIFSRYEKSMNLMAEVIMLSSMVEVYDNSGSIPVKVFEKNTYGEQILLNREIRNEWVDQFIAHPLRIKNAVINADLTCEETEAVKNSDDY
ncbi:zeta toxin family protein [Methanimicrococcus blatticola]|uniref:zeta toxin family protein n=1 Tax=Methanimicrococcus blatticola TaxID=91560 RepID=UPI00106083E3|nr:zeta toxin family protein [Methanimicrococcus blatticola]MBZ3935974.1 zeta toxin family protein [Methanimicrococcus blatticola]MCC2509413.1 zeta toxin family protein [Methanimicrococcus blatticola]